MTTCPKCQHVRNPKDDQNIPEYQCPECGVIYKKFMQKKQLELKNTSNAILKNIQSKRNSNRTSIPSEENNQINKDQLKKIILTSILVLFVTWGLAVLFNVFLFQNILIPISLFVIFSFLIYWDFHVFEVPLKINIPVSLIISLSISNLIYANTKEASAWYLGFESTTERSKALVLGFTEKEKYDIHVENAKKRVEEYKKSMAILAEKKAKEEHEIKIYEMAFGSKEEYAKITTKARKSLVQYEMSLNRHRISSIK